MPGTRYLTYPAQLEPDRVLDVPRQPRGTNKVIALVRRAIAFEMEGLSQSGKPCLPRVASTTRSGFCLRSGSCWLPPDRRAGSLSCLASSVCRTPPSADSPERAPASAREFCAPAESAPIADTLSPRMHDHQLRSSDQRDRQGASKR